MDVRQQAKCASPTHKSPLVVDSAPRKGPRCTCLACIGGSVRAARKHLRRGNLELGAAVLELLSLDLPPSWAYCTRNIDPGVLIPDLQWQVRRYTGWARAYAVPEQQRLEACDKCPCVAGGWR